MALTIAAFLLLLASPVAAGVGLYFEGEPMEPDVPPQIVNGRTFLPMRFMGELIDADVQWHAQPQIALLEVDGALLEVPIGSNRATVNELTVQLDEPARIVDGRTLLPARFLLEALGFMVVWEPQGRNVHVTVNKNHVLAVGGLDTVGGLEAIASADARDFSNGFLDDITWPLEGVLTSGHGPRGRRFHNGIDVAAPYGTPIVASASGEITFAGWISGYGNLLRIDHGNGFETWYAHLQSFGVTVGRTVKAGDVVSWVGMTGRSTGPHLHFEIRVDGHSRNPLDYLP